MKIICRELLGMSWDQLMGTLNVPRCKVTAVCDDGEIETTAREILFSAISWKYQKQYPKAPLYTTHIMDPKVQLNKNTTIDLIRNSFWDSYYAYEALGSKIPTADLSKIAYEVTNDYYNFIVNELPEYITGLSAKDFIEVLTHPEVIELLSKAQPTQRSIDEANKGIEKVLMRPGEFEHNRLAESARSKLTSIGQVLQTVGVRGYVTDIDSTIFRNPIMTGYATGFRSLHDHAIETRSCSKALFFAKYPLADVEYLNRQLQLAGEYLMHVFDGDCGSDWLLPLNVKSSKDLRTYKGKYYYAPDGTMARITEESTELIGTTVSVRSPLGCRCLPKQGVCEVCLGEIAQQIPFGGNLGHLSTIELCSGVSQSVLSVKHHDTSAHTNAFVIPYGDEPYIALGKRENTINLKPDLKGRTIKLLVPKAAAFNLTEINHITNLQTLPIGRVSEIEYVTLAIEEDNGDTQWIDIMVSVGSKKSSFTVEFLAYLRGVNWEINDEQSYEFDISSWNFSKPVFELPMKHVNVMEFMSNVSDIIKLAKLKSNRKKQAHELANNPESTAQLVMELHDLVNSRFKLNIAHCEVIMAVALVKSVEGDDFTFPGPDTEREFVQFKQHMQYRCFSQMLAFQELPAKIIDPRAFTIMKRPIHPMSDILMPRQFH